MLQNPETMPEVAAILQLLKDGQVKEAYRDLQLVIDKPDISPELKAELCNVSSSLLVRILNSGI
jgi:predicted component of type VI protein secretion system